MCEDQVRGRTIHLLLYLELAQFLFSFIRISDAFNNENEHKKEQGLYLLSTSWNGGI